MKTSRRSAVLTFVLLATASAASAGERWRGPEYPCNKYIDDCRDQEQHWGCERYGKCPPPKPCRDPNGICKSDPMKDVSDKTAGIATSIGKGDFTKASESLDGLFSGSGIKPGGKKESSSDSAVYAGPWKTESRLSANVSDNEAMRTPLVTRDSAMRPLIERLDGEHAARIITVGDANPKSNDGEVIGALAGAVAGAVAGPAGAIAGGVAGAAGGWLHDVERKQDKDEATYQKGNEDRRRDQQGE